MPIFHVAYSITRNEVYRCAADNPKEAEDEAQQEGTEIAWAGGITDLEVLSSHEEPEGLTDPLECPLCNFNP